MKVMTPLDWFQLYLLVLFKSFCCHKVGQEIHLGNRILGRFQRVFSKVEFRACEITLENIHIN
jgi:hypothetical protein